MKSIILKGLAGNEGKRFIEEESIEPLPVPKGSISRGKLELIVRVIVESKGES